MYTYTASSVSYWQCQCHRQQARDLSVQYDAWNPTKCRLLAINGCPTYHWCIYTDMCKSTWIWFLRTFHKLIQVKNKKIQRVTSIKHVFLCPRDYWSGGILFYSCPSVHSSHLVCIVCLANSSYSFWARPFIFCRQLVLTLEVCIFYGFWLSTNFLRWIIYHSLKLSYIENPIWPFTFLRTKPKVKVVNWGGVGLRWIRLRRGHSIFYFFFLFISALKVRRVHSNVIIHPAARGMSG